ncbi:transposase [Bombilactobacillus apium]|uniref:transposase n=1 Tax=Bombilactobacillus apium TaxID=2675299 RepID=UPI0038991DB4
MRRRFDVSICHQKITTELKYFKTDTSGTIRAKKLYLDPFLDMYSSEITAYRISEKPNALAIMAALEEAIQVIGDRIYRRTFHIDQKIQYQNSKFWKLLRSNQILWSMSRKVTCLDIASVESFFHQLKVSVVHNYKAISYVEVEQQIKTYLNYYSNCRIKEKMDGLSPVDTGNKPPRKALNISPNFRR